MQRWMSDFFEELFPILLSQYSISFNPFLEDWNYGTLSVITFKLLCDVIESNIIYISPISSIMFRLRISNKREIEKYAKS